MMFFFFWVVLIDVFLLSLNFLEILEEEEDVENGMEDDI